MATSRSNDRPTILLMSSNIISHELGSAYVTSSRNKTVQLLVVYNRCK